MSTFRQPHANKAAAYIAGPDRSDDHSPSA
jgi:hypothetical protein